MSRGPRVGYKHGTGPPGGTRAHSAANHPVRGRGGTRRRAPRPRFSPPFNVTIDDVSAVAKCATDARGLLGIDGVAPNPSDLSLEITVALSSPAHRVEAMLAAWRERCPIYLAVLKPNAISLSTAKVS